MLFLVAIAFPTLLAAQPDTVDVPGDISPGEGSLNTAIQTAIDARTLSNKVFKLELNSRYVLNGTITVPAGEHLTIVAPEPGTTQATAPPQILWTSTSGLDMSYIFNCYGDLTLKNVWVFYANTQGDQVGSCIVFQDDPLSIARRCNFEGVILDYSPCPALAGGSVTVACTNFKGIFKNTYWKNCNDRHLRYYGRAVSFPFATTGWHGDSLIFENCTFANMGYVLMQEGGEYTDYVKSNDCAFLNVVMYPMESGWWNKLTVTNSIFANTQMIGQIPSQTGTGDPYGATLRIDSVATFGFTVQFTEQDRRILFTNSIYHLDQWLVVWMGYGPNGNPYSKDLHAQGRDDEVPVPMPMLSPRTLRFFDSTFNGQKVFPYMNRANLYDSTDPGFLFPPSDTGAIKSFIFRRWYDCSDTLWAWKPENSINQLWPLEENLAYTNDIVKTAGMGGFPLGDLYHW